MDWQNEPATWKQLRYLKQHGYKTDRHLTKTAAAELIHELGGDFTLATAVPEPVAHQIPQQDAFLLRTQVDQAIKAAANAHRENFQALQQELALAVSKRQLFWIDTCRDPTRMQAACGQVLEFYRKFGCRFEPPSHRQVQEVLSALDSAMPSWDRDHSDLFYQTLELNFPELAKKR
jgi:hypothetical protein